MGELWERWWPTLVGGLLLAGGALLFWPRATEQPIEAEAPAAVSQGPTPAAASARPTEQDEEVSRERQLEEARLRAAVRAAQEEPARSSEGRRPTDDTAASKDAEPVGPMRLTEQSPEVRTALSQVEVEIYETAWCKYCRKTRAFLDQNGIRYRAYDVEADSVAKARKSDLAPGAGVPVVVIDEQLLVGFSEAALEAAFQAAVGRRLRVR
jgi:glutaredoxin